MNELNLKEDDIHKSILTKPILLSILLSVSSFSYDFLVLWLWMGEKYVRTHCFRAEDDDDIVTRVDDVTGKRGRSGESHGNQVSDSL